MLGSTGLMHAVVLELVSHVQTWGSGHALMAQGPPQQQHVMPESSQSAQQLPHQRPSHISSKGGQGEGSSDSPQTAADGRVVPGINILLVAVEHLSQWLPPATLLCNKQNDGQLADISSQATKHHSCICALLLMQKETPVSKVSSKPPPQPPQLALPAQNSTGHSQHQYVTGQSHTSLPHADCSVKLEPADVLPVLEPVAAAHDQEAKLASDYLTYTASPQATSQIAAVRKPCLPPSHGSLIQTATKPPIQSQSVVLDESANASASLQLAATAQQSKHACHDGLSFDLAQLPSKRQRMQGVACALQASKQQQQQQQHSPQYHAKHDESNSTISCDDIIDDVLTGIKQLGLIHAHKHLAEPLSASQRVRLQAQPFLMQLCLVGNVATSCSSDASRSQPFEHAYSRLIAQSTPQLLRHAEPAQGSILCSRAQKLFDQLSSRTDRLCNAVPDDIAQILPTETQAAYILCLAGYSGPKPLPDFAADVMHCIQVQTDQAARTNPTTLAAQHVAEPVTVDCAMSETASADCAVGEHASVDYAVTDPVSPDYAVAEPAPPDYPVAEPAFIDYAVGSPPDLTASPQREHEPALHQSERSSPTPDHALIDEPIAESVEAQSPPPCRQMPTSSETESALDKILSVEAALIKLGLMQTRLPERAIDLLQLQSPFAQLTVLSVFCTRASYIQDPLLHLSMLCSMSSKDDISDSCVYAPRSNDRTVYTFTDLAVELEVSTTRNVWHEVEGSIFILPQQLRCVAACYAVGVFLRSADDKEALARLQTGFTQMRQLFRRAQLAKKFR